MNKKKTIILLSVGFVTVAAMLGVFALQNWLKPAPSMATNDTKQNDVINILVLGVDDVQDETQSRRSDTIMLCSLDFRRDDVSVLSIPRDTLAKVDKLDKNGRVTESVETKINHSFMYVEDNTHAPLNTIKSVSRLLSCDGEFDVPIDYYAVLDFESIAEFTDLIGGVDITLENSTPLFGEAGETVHLTSDNVRLFLADRKNMPRGDLTRQENQQLFLREALKKVQQESVLSDALKFQKIYSECIIATNLMPGNILEYARFLNGLEEKDIKSQVLDCGENKKLSDGIMYFVLDEKAMRDVVMGIPSKNAEVGKANR